MIKYQGHDITTVWVDLDDTLIDFFSNSRAALRKLYSAEGLDKLWATADAWIDCYERYNTALWIDYNMARISRPYLRMERFRQPLVEAGADDTRAREMSERFDGLYLDLLAKEKNLIPGAKELLRTIRSRGAKVGILSNGFKEVQHRKIDSAGLADLIDIVVLSDDIDVTKPDIRLYNYAMKRSGYADPANHMMIGDNPTTDIAGAIATGWSAISLNRWQEQPVVNSGAYLTANSLAIICNLISD